MNQPRTEKQTFIAAAHQLRRDYLAALLANALRSLSHALRVDHERALRRASRVIQRRRTTIGTPA